MKKKATKRSAKATSRQSTLNFPTSSEADLVAESVAAETSTKSGAKNRRKRTADFADDADKHNKAQCDSSAISAQSAVKTQTLNIANSIPSGPTEIPKPWYWGTLGDILKNIDTGKSFRCDERPPHSHETGVIKVSAVTWGTYDESESKTCVDASRINEQYLVNQGDFLFSRANTIPLIGACVIADNVTRRMMLSDKILRFRFKSDILPKWVLYWLRSTLGHREIERLSTGNQESMRNIGQDRIRQIQIPLAPLPEQHRIVAEIEKQFTRLDAGVAALKRVQANLKRYRAAVLKAACEGKLVPTEAELRRTADYADKKMRPSASSAKSAVKTPPFETGEQLLQRILTERRQNWQGRGQYKEPEAPETKNLAPVPDAWTWATVEQVATVVQYGSSAKTNADSSGVPVLRMGNIQDGKFEFDKLKYLPASHDEFPELLLSPGDLLFNRTNSAELVGKTAVFRISRQPCSFASYLIRVRFGVGCIPELVSYFINSVFGRAWIAEVVSQQVGQANVNGTKLQALPIPLPPLAEQTRIVEEVERRLNVVDELEAVVSANLQRSARLRQSILQKAFTGGI